MSIPPAIVTCTRAAWSWQWRQLMKGLAPTDPKGNYRRPSSDKPHAIGLSKEELIGRSEDQKPRLIVGKSCPWAHRTWLVHQLRGLRNNLSLLVVKADHNSGRWKLEEEWLGCNSLLELYQLCGSPPSHRATVPALIDPGSSLNRNPRLIGNESAQLVEVLNRWPTTREAPDLAPERLKEEINTWQKLLQPTVNDGVYRCGFARNQNAYNKACEDLFSALEVVEQALSKKGPWLCGSQLTLADVRLFPTLIRWEMIYMPLFGCSQKPLWSLPKLWEWRQRFMAIPLVAETCDSKCWREDYFGALFPLRPSGIIPAGPELSMIVNAVVPQVQ